MVSFIDDLTKEELLKRVEWFEKKYGPYIEKRGFHNWKNLFNKPTLNEWVILFLMIMGLFIAWAYWRDISVCRETIENQQAFFEAFQEQQNRTIDFKIPDINASKIIITNISGGEENGG